MTSDETAVAVRRSKTMKTILAVLVAAVAAGAGPAADTSPASSAPRPADIEGAWAGTVTHDGETVDFALEVEPADDGKVLLKLTVPVVHLAHTAIGQMPLEIHGSDVRMGPFAFSWDGERSTLTGTVPEAFAPVYALPLVLHRVDAVSAPPRPAPGAPLAEPLWSFEAGAALWAGPTFTGGVVYAGAEDGRVHALDASTGRERWSFAAGGPVRTRPTVAGVVVYLQADDGFLYALSAEDGHERWRTRVVGTPVVRRPFDDPKSRYDRFGSDVTVAGGRLYLGTHDGHVLALDPAHGERLWDFAAGDSVLAAPAVDGGRVYFGSFDGKVRALDAVSGRLLWERDTRGPVVSTPALAGDRIVVGNRTYDLLALDAASGETRWKRYIWFSWVESSATVRDGVAYVGSSDAAALSAFDVATGRRLWATDVHGWAWGQPAVTAERVFVGTSSTRGYLAAHEGGMMAVDRVSGRPVWRYALAPPSAGPFGFPGSPAVGAGRVFVTGLDGRVYAFAQ
jgi:outer membrane protein assembly factor BamB